MLKATSWNEKDKAATGSNRSEKISVTEHKLLHVRGYKADWIKSRRFQRPLDARGQTNLAGTDKSTKAQIRTFWRNYRSRNGKSSPFGPVTELAGLTQTGQFLSVLFPIDQYLGK